MDERQWIAGITALALFFLAIYSITLIIMERRKRQWTARLEKMLEDAIAGRFQEENFDESRLSVLENSLWQYLCQQEGKWETLTRDRERLQQQVSDISHQAVLPVSNILLYSQLLEEGLDRLWGEMESQNAEVSEMREELAVIREQARELEFLMEGLVKLSRLELGIIHVQTKRQPLASLLRSIRQQFRIKAEQKGLIFHVEDTEDWAVYDEKWSLEALSNLVDNAIKYTPAGGKIQVRTQALTSLVRIDVTDTGRGISEEEQARIFQRFYRSPDVQSSPGVGIGLYIAREVMKAQNGYIRLTSGDGKGSTFSLYFLSAAPEL